MNGHTITDGRPLLRHTHTHTSCILVNCTTVLHAFIQSARLIAFAPIAADINNYVMHSYTLLCGQSTDGRFPVFNGCLLQNEVRLVFYSIIAPAAANDGAEICSTGVVFV